MAPEILLDEVYGSQSDVFSVGVIVYFILTGELPFYSEENELVVKKIVEGDYDLDGPQLDDISEGAKDFIKSMLEIDPSKRITIKKALSHSWIRDKNFLPKTKRFEKKSIPEVDSFDLQKFV